MQAETWFDMDRATWQRLHDVASTLPWTLVTAGGVVQAAACTGEGTPTVVYINGFGSRASWSWPLAADQQARDNRVCLFDRPGLGLSPSRAESVPRSTPEQQAGEMLAMLAVLGEPGPYLLVAHSYGGLVARSAATQQPDAVAGMVLVDATSPLTPGLDEPLTGENGITDVTTIATTVGSGPGMGDRPVIVLEAGQQPSDATADDRAAWSELQRQAATISDNGLHAVVDDSNHDIPMRNPAAVVAATSAVAQSIRAGNADLPACPDAMAAAGVTCTGG
jgi:pimeloyl-ACP methyl ester carboxylesterase